MSVHLTVRRCIVFDRASKYAFVLDFQSFLLLHLIEEYVNGAELQIHRIDRTRGVIRRSLAGREFFEQTGIATHNRRNRRLFHDTHFYFICIGQVSKSFKQLCERLRNPRLKKLRERLDREFSREIRNDLEHLDERAVGKKRGVDIGFIRDFKNFSDDKLTFNGKSYPVNRASLNNLKSIYKELVRIVHEDYAMWDPKFVEREQRDRHTQKLNKAARKMYETYHRGRT